MTAPEAKKREKNDGRWPAPLDHENKAQFMLLVVSDFYYVS